MTKKATDALKNCIKRGCPYGDEDWLQSTAQQQGLELTLRPRGRQKILPSLPIWLLTPFYFSPQSPTVRPGRVVLVASGRGNGNYQTQRKVLRELAVQFRAQGMFEVVVPEDLLLYGQSDNILQGKCDEAELATVSRKHSADAVGIVRVNGFRSADPMRIGVSLAIIDSAESIQSLGAVGVWDLAGNETSVAFENFLSASASADLYEQRVRRQAPVWLFQFSASRMVETIMSSGY